MPKPKHAHDDDLADEFERLDEMIRDSFPRALGYVTTCAMAAESEPTGVLAQRDALAIPYTLRTAEDYLWQIVEDLGGVASRLRETNPKRRMRNGKA